VLFAHIQSCQTMHAVACWLLCWIKRRFYDHIPVEESACARETQSEDRNNL